MRRFLPILFPLCAALVVAGLPACGPNCDPACDAETPFCIDEGARCVECLTSADCYSAEVGAARCDDNVCVRGCSEREDCRDVVNDRGNAQPACLRMVRDFQVHTECGELPDDWLLSDDGQGYCAPRRWPSCDCTSLSYYCDFVPCDLFDSACDHAPDDYVERVDEHGCPGYDLVNSGFECEW
jgi:hypothetical protein